MSPGKSPLTVDSQSTGSEPDEDTRSLNKSLLDYPVLFNRRYHKYKEGSYNLPNDEKEQDRLDRSYLITKAAQNGKLFFAPTKDPQHILDIGTGTGLWCIEVADSGLARNAKITGIDLSPIQPIDVPENVYFELQDASETDWARPLDSFDLIHSRLMLGSFRDFSETMRTARKYLKPGNGWMECCELLIQPMCDDGTMPDDWGYKEYEKLVAEAYQKAGRSMRVAVKLEKWMEDAGFVDVRQILTKIPIGSWPANKELKRIGKAWSDMISDNLATFCSRVFSEQFGWTQEEIEVYVAGVRKSLQMRHVHAYQLYFCVLGRKPSVEEEAKIGAQKMGSQTG